MGMPAKFNKPILKNLWSDVYVRNTNALIGITGPVGSGKSHTGVNIGVKFDKKFDLKNNVVYTVHDLLAACFGSIKIKGKPITLDTIKGMSASEISEFLEENVKTIKVSPGRVIVFDEAGSGIYIREFFSQDNKTISKLIMMVRFLRIIIIFVVPEDLKYMESTVINFLNYKITMVGTPKADGAKCIVNRFTGWNPKTKEPYKPRIAENVGRSGHIIIGPLPKDIADQYEEIAKIMKIKAMASLMKEYKEKPLKESKDINECVDEIVSNSERFIKNHGRGKGTITIPTIAAIFNMPEYNARKVKLLAEERLGLNK